MGTIWEKLNQTDVIKKKQRDRALLSHLVNKFVTKIS